MAVNSSLQGREKKVERSLCWRGWTFLRSHAWSTSGLRKWRPAAIALPRCISASREDVWVDLGAPWGCWYFASRRKDAVMESPVLARWDGWEMLLCRWWGASWYIGCCCGETASLEWEGFKIGMGCQKLGRRACFGGEKRENWREKVRLELGEMLPCPASSGRNLSRCLLC